MSFHMAGISALVFALLANVAAAQSVNRGPTSNSPSNGAGIDGRARKEVPASLVLPQRESLPALKVQDRPSRGRRDSVWNGALIGAGVGAAGGAIWGLEICGSNDTECFAIAGPVGILGGAGIGAVVGAIADALHN